jgi:MFS family permease
MDSESFTQGQAAARVAEQAVENAPPRLLPFVLIVFIGYLTIGMPLPVIPIQVREVLNYGPLIVGWIIGSQSLATLLTRPYAGLICDTRGPKRSVVFGLITCSLAGICYWISASLANPFPAASLAILLAGRLILGLGESLTITGTLAWATSLIGPKKSGRVMVWVGIAMYGAIAVGAPIGIYLNRARGFASVAQLGAILPIVALGIAISVRRAETIGGKRASFLAVVSTIWPLGSRLALATISFGAIGAFITLDYAAHGWPGAGFALTGFGFAFIVVRLVFGHLPDQIGGKRVAQVSLTVAVLGQLLLWMSDRSSLAMLGVILTGAGLSLVFPAFGVSVVKRVPPANRGAALGAYVAFFDIGLGVAGPATGLVASRYGYPAVFLAGAIAAAIGLISTLQMRSAAD